MYLLNIAYQLEVASCIFQSLLGYICIAMEFGVSLHYATLKLSIQEISGLGLANFLVSLIVVAVGHGFNQSVNINVAQAIGSSNRPLAQKYLNITIYTHILANFLVGITVYQSITLCAYLIKSDSDIVISAAKTYFPFTVIAALLFSIYESIKLYMIAHKIFNPFKYIHITTFLAHIFWCYLFVIFLDMKILGLGAAIILSQVFNIILLLIYIITYQREIFEGFVYKFILIEQYQFYFDYILNSINLLVHILAEYLIFLVIYFLSYYLGNMEANASLALGSTLRVYYRLPICTSIAIQTFLGHELGQSNIPKAKLYAAIGIVQYTVTITILIAINWIFRQEWANFLSQDRMVINELLDDLPTFTITILLIYGYYACLTGVLKGADKADIVSISTILIYYVVGGPMMGLLVLHYGLGLKGIYIGFGIGNLALLLYYLLEIWRIDWVQQKEKIQEKLQFSHNLIKK